MKTAEEMRQVAKQSSSFKSLSNRIQQQIYLSAKDGFTKTEYLVEVEFDEGDVDWVKSHLEYVGYTVVIEESSAFVCKLVISW